MSEKINLGVDFSSFRKALTGVSFYTQKMLSALDSTQISITGFSPYVSNSTAITVDQMKIPSWDLQKISLWPPLWRQLYLPHQLKTTHLDLFWSPNHILPWQKITHIPYILTIHDLVWKTCPSTMDKKTYYHEKIFMPLSVKRADIIICVSQNTKQDLIRFLQVPEKKIHVIYEAPIHTQQAYTPIYKKLHDNKSFILALGTQEPRKNYLRLIEAYAKLSPDLQQEFKLVIVGKKGWGNINLESLIQERNLNDSIIIHDYLPQEAVSYLLQQATCLAFPSLYEGFGLPLVEAMAMGTPILTSNIGAMAEITANAAYLVDPHDINSIASGLQIVLQNESLRKDLAQKGLQRASYFSWEKAASEFSKIITDLV